MAAMFKQAGFDVVRNERDIGITELRRALREFSETSEDADISVVYYAGHGIEIDGTNYLVPADAKLSSDFDIEDETVSLDRVLKALNPVKRLKLVILDACRENPFTNRMKRNVVSRAIGRGLARVEPTTSDTLVAFAARAGALASDGDRQNSPFAIALVKYLAEPGLDLRLAFGRVRDEVLKSTGNRQEPFVYGSLGGETVALVPQSAKPVDPEAEARVDYELAAQVGTKEAWDSFLASHKAGLYANLARAQNEKLAAAQRSRAKADDARREAEEQAALKAVEFRRQLEEQSARQTAEAKQKLSEQAKKDLEETRRQIAEQAKKELDEAKRQVEISQQQAEAARQQVELAKRQAIAEAQLQVEQAKRSVKAEAERLAALAPTQTAPPSPPPAPQIDPADIARLLQAHLKRVGCDPGSADGKWDNGSRRALELFNVNAKTKFDVKLASLDALDAVRSKTDRVCPLICDKGQRIDGDRCVQVSCSTGYFLNSSGACEKRPETDARVDYELAAQVGTKEAWDSFLATHAKGLYADLARAQNDKLAAAQLSRAKADGARREAEEQAAQKAVEFRRQLEEQSALQTAVAKQKLSEQAKKDLEEARRQVAEQAQKELDEAKRQVELAQQQAEAARQQVEETKRQAAANAQLQIEQARQADKAEAAKLAALTPTQPIPSGPLPAPPQMDPTDIARLLQAHLKRVGCNPGTSDGKWDESSQKALAQFNKNAQTVFDIKLASLDALDAVRGKTDRVCPLVCDKGQRAEGDRCIQIGCSTGYFLNSSGACEKRPEPSPKPRAAAQREPAAHRASPPVGAGRSGGGKCFSFNGKSYCE